MTNIQHIIIANRAEDRRDAERKVLAAQDYAVPVLAARMIRDFYAEFPRRLSNIGHDQ